LQSFFLFSWSSAATTSGVLLGLEARGGIAEYAGICFIINLHSMGSYLQSERGVVLHRRPHHSLLLFSDWGVARYVLLHVAYHAVSH